MCSIFSSQRDRSGLCAGLEVKTTSKWSTTKLLEIQKEVQRAHNNLVREGYHQQEKNDKKCPVSLQELLELFQ